MKHINQEALVWLVNTIWTKYYLDCIIINVFDYLERVLSLINDSHGGNDLVETKSGIKHEGMKFDLNIITKYSEECNGDTSDDIQNVIRNNADDKVEFTAEFV